jgi:aspartate/methionine/tyrosine aminotransferase
MLNTRSRMDAIQAPIIAVIGDLIRQHPGTISLGQGVVHYGPPQAALDAARAALPQPETHGYQDGAGIPQLVAAIEAKLRRDNGIECRNGLRVMVTAGGNMAFVHAILAITQPGDEVILPVPFYFNHEMAIQMADCAAVLVPTDDRYQLNLDAIRRAITPRTRAIVTVTPNNPTGAVFPEAALREVNDLCARHGLFHISDEVYEYFTYGSAAHASPGAFDGATRIRSRCSRCRRLRLRRLAHRLHGVPGAAARRHRESPGHGARVPPVLSQIAAVAAMAAGPAYCRQHLESFAEVRDIVLSELRALEPLCTVPPADGAVLLLPARQRGRRSVSIAERLIREHRVAVVPGMPSVRRAAAISHRLRRAAESHVAEGDRTAGERPATDTASLK